MPVQQLKYLPKDTQRNGWAVVERIGNAKRKTERVVHIGGLTMHQASHMAATMQRDFNLHGVRPEAV